MLRSIRCFSTSNKSRAFKMATQWLPESNLRVAINSKAGHATSVHVTTGKKFSILFDIGSVEHGYSSAKDVFVSHSHIDHIGGLFNHARIASMGNKRVRFYAPEYSIEHLLKAKIAFEALDSTEGKELPIDFIGMKSGDTIKLGGMYHVEAFSTQHRVPSLGYALFETKMEQKPEYSSLSNAEKATLAKAGTKLTAPHTKCVLVYTGDTKMEGILQNPVCFEAEMLITEATLLGLSNGDHKEKARGNDHIHLDEFVEHADLFINSGIKRLILCHFSVRYTKHSIVEAFNKKFPSALLDKTCVALKAFGGNDLYLGDQTSITRKVRIGPEERKHFNRSPKPKRKPRYCRFYNTSNGCRLGKSCTFQHMKE